MKRSISAKATISSNLRSISALLHAEDGAVQIGVLAPGQIGVKAGADLEQRSDAPGDVGEAGGRLGDLRQDLQQRGFAGAVAADDADRLRRRATSNDTSSSAQSVSSAVRRRRRRRTAAP